MILTLRIDFNFLVDRINSPHLRNLRNFLCNDNTAKIQSLTYSILDHPVVIHRSSAGLE